MKYPVSEIKCSKCSMCQLVEKISLDPIAGTNIYYKCLAKAENECKKESEKSGFYTLDAIKYLIEGKKIRKKTWDVESFLYLKDGEILSHLNSVCHIRISIQSFAEINSNTWEFFTEPRYLLRVGKSIAYIATEGDMWTLTNMPIYMNTKTKSEWQTFADRAGFVIAPEKFELVVWKNDKTVNQ